MAICTICGKKYNRLTTPVSAKRICSECFFAQLEAEASAGDLQPTEEGPSDRESQPLPPPIPNSLGHSTRVEDFLQHEGILVSQRGVFEVQLGKQFDGVEKADIAQIRVAYASAAERPVLEGAVGVSLLAAGLWGVRICFRSLLAFYLYSWLLVMGILGAAMLWDVLKRRYVLFVIARDGRLYKLPFSVAAYPRDIELFLKKVHQTFGLDIYSDVTEIRPNQSLEPTAGRRGTHI